MTTTTTNNLIGAFLHQWSEINPGQHRDRIDFERAGTDWSDVPVTLACPAGWHTSMSGGGTVELYDATGRHVALVQVRGDHRAVQWTSAAGVGWIAVRMGGERACCPTCGQPR